MANPKYTNVKGKRVDFSSFEITIQSSEGGSPVPLNKGLTGIDWGNTRSAKLRFGSSATPLGQTRGQLTPTATLKYEYEEWALTRKALGDGYMELPLNITGTWIESGVEGSVFIEGATIMDEQESVSQDGSPEYTIVLLPSAPVIADGVSPLATA